MIQKIAEAADNLENMKRKAKHAERAKDKEQKGRELPRNQATPVSDTIPSNIAWWTKES